MEKKVLFAALILLSIMSCKKDRSFTYEETFIDKVSEGKKVEIVISIGKEKTKALIADTQEEAKINNVQILVFREDGVLDAYKKALNSPVSGVVCTAGNRSVYAIVNYASDLSGVKKLDELLSKAFLFTDEKIGGFQMIGHKSLNVSSSTGEVAVTASRAVAKIHFSGIRTDFEAPAYKNSPVALNKIYAINIAGAYDFSYPDASSLPSLNAGSLEASLALNQRALLVFEPENPLPVTNGAAALSIDKNFYVYPNFSENDRDKTRIVVEVSIDGKLFYYPLTFAVSLKNNTLYDIKGLVIKRPGSNSPNLPVKTEDCDFNLSVSDWEEGEDMTVTI